jgi:inosine-uridine nucleoside N-ribohydrolase
MRRWIVAGVLALALGSACGTSEAGVTHVVIDNDGAFDDIKAIVYLLERPDVEVLAITVSGTGIARCPAAAENIAAMLDRIGSPGIPVACGRDTPLRGSNQAPEAWRNAADTLGGVDLPEPPDLGDTTAPELLAETIAANDEVVLVALGPLTNVAEAFDDDPELVDRVEMMYLMGGAIEAGGNVFDANTRAEFNIWADSLAAEMVFKTDVPITMVPLDATNAVPVTPYLYDVVVAHRDTSPVTEFMAEYLDATPLLGGMYHWDELAAVVATDESVVTVEEQQLVVVAAGGASSGAIVPSDSGRPVRVATDADSGKFEDAFYGSVLGTDDTGVAAWEPDATLSWDGSDCVYVGPDPLPASMWIRIDNEGPELIAWVLGTYDPDATGEDWDAYVASGSVDPPEWWTDLGQAAVPAGAHDVWPVEAGPGTTALCYADPVNFWEVAGQRLSG